MTDLTSTSKSALSSYTLLIAMMAGIFLLPWQTFAATIKAGPWLQAATQTSIVIMWETDVSLPGKVEYGLSTGYGELRAPNTPLFLLPTTTLARTPGPLSMKQN